MEIAFNSGGEPNLIPLDLFGEYCQTAENWIEVAMANDGALPMTLDHNDRSRAFARATALYQAWSYAVYPRTGDPLREEPMIFYVPSVSDDNEFMMFVFKADNNGNTYRFLFDEVEFAAGTGDPCLSEANLSALAIYKKNQG